MTKKLEALDMRWLRNVANVGRGSAMTDALHKAADEIDLLRALCKEQKILLEHGLGAWNTICDAYGWDREHLEQFAAISSHLRQHEGKKYE